MTLPADVFSEGAGLALGGGVVAMGASRQDGDRALPELLIRAADGSLRSVPLPGGAGNAETSEDLVGPLAAIDGSGHGLVVWGATRAVDGQLLAARFDSSGALGPAHVLTGDGLDRTFTDPSVAVGPDGAASVAWVAGRRTTVLTGTTSGGFDLASATSAPLHWAVAVEPHGAAVAVDARYNGERGRVRIATRAAAKPFSAVRSYRAGEVGDQEPALAVERGRYLVAFAARPTAGSTELGLLKGVSGHTGDRPGPAVSVPIASAEVTEVAAALPPTDPPTVLTTTQRSTDCVKCTSLRDRFEIDAFRFSSRPPRRPRGVSARLAPRQRLGHPQAVRVRVRCPRRCAVRVAGSVSEAGAFDTSRALRPGTTVLRVPYSSGGGSGPFKPLRRARRTRLGIAIDDATGELRLRRTVVVRPGIRSTAPRQRPRASYPRPPWTPFATHHRRSASRAKKAAAALRAAPASRGARRTAPVCSGRQQPARAHGDPAHADHLAQARRDPVADQSGQRVLQARVARHLDAAA